LEKFLSDVSFGYLWCAFVNMATNNMIDVFTDTSKILIYFVVGDSENFQPPGFQAFSSFQIPFLLRRIIMLRSVQFHDQSCIVAVEIYDVMVYYFLT
jgi:hypothetical protein